MGLARVERVNVGIGEDGVSSKVTVRDTFGNLSTVEGPKGRTVDLHQTVRVEDGKIMEKINS